MNSQARNALRRLEQQRAAGSFGNAAALCPVSPDARIGDRFIIRLPDNIRLADERSRVRPAILWGIYRNGDGNIVAADFLNTSTRQNGTQRYAGIFPLSFIEGVSGSYRDSYIKLNTLHTLSNRGKSQGGFILDPANLRGRVLIPYLPDLIVRRAFGLCMNNALTCFQEPGLDLSGTVREGIYFPMLKPCNLRGDLPQPDVPDESQPFRHRDIILPGRLTQNDVNRIVQWSDWWGQTGRRRDEGWPGPGTFRTSGWPEWGDFEKKWSGSFKDWQKIPEKDRFPNGRSGADHGNCNSVTQPLPDPAPSRL